MGHSTTEEYLNRENIEEYFQLLAETIEKANIGEHQILVVGGAAMALKYHDGRSTVDIDICIREQHNLYACCQQVAKEKELPEDWINADVMHSDSFSYGLFENAKLYKTFAAAGDNYQKMIDASAAMRTGSSDEIAEAGAFLLGEHAGFINGTDLLIDGGTIAAMRTRQFALGE